MARKIKAEIDEKAVADELERLKSLFKEADPYKLQLYDNLFQRAAFLSVVLQHLEKQILKAGVIEEYQNGEFQKGRKKSSEAALFVDYQKLYLSTMKEIRNCLGDSLSHEMDEFEAFMAGREERSYQSEQNEELDEFERF